MPLTTPDRVLSWVKKDTTFDPARQDELARCIAAATSILARVTGRQMERVTRSLSLNGNDACGKDGELLFLPKGDRYVLHTTGPNLITVTENGSSLAMLTGYTNAAGCLVVDANVDRPCQLIRTTGYWTPGYQNILVGYKCGWTVDDGADPQPVPDYVIQLANCVAWKLFQEPAWLGKLNVSNAGSAVTLSSDLPPEEAAILSSLVIR